MIIMEEIAEIWDGDEIFEIVIIMYNAHRTEIDYLCRSLSIELC